MILLASVLLLTILLGLWRILRGPTPADRLLAMQLFGTTGAAFLLVLSMLTDERALRDAALVIALLAAVLSAALVQYLRHRSRERS